MNLPRRSIAKLMAVVVIVALNMAAARALFFYDAELIIGVAPIGIALEIGLLRSIRSRGRVRVFWLGFVAAGSATVTSFSWAVVYEESRCSYIWSLYTNSSEYISPLFFNGFGPSIIWLSIIWFIPHLLISIIFGLLASSIIKRHCKTPADETRPTICQEIPGRKLGRT